MDPQPLWATGECVPSPQVPTRSPFQLEGCAMFPTSSFDPETLGVLTGVFEDAWIDIQGMLGPTPIDPERLRSALARRIMSDERGEQRS